MSSSFWLSCFALVLRAGMTQSANSTACGVVPTSLGPSARIVGGHPARKGQFPWMAYLLTNGVFSCGGSIIDNLHVVTAAHCIGVDEVIAGKHEFDTRINYTGEQKLKVASFISHPRYEKDSGKAANDVAILRLNTSLVFSNTVVPLCLPSDTPKLPPLCTVAGWGYIDQNRGSPTQLMTFTESPYNRDECITMKPELSDIIAKNTMCLANMKCLANPKLPVNTTFHGDSGGPAFYRVDEKSPYQLLGVVSLGYSNCKEAYPMIFTYVPDYVTWIKDTATNLAPALTKTHAVVIAVLVLVALSSSFQ